MIEPFQREYVPGLGPEGYLTPVANEAARWFFTEKTIATREYKGKLLRQTKNGWEHYEPTRVFYDYPGDSQQVTGYKAAGWQPIYPKVSYFRQALQVLKNTWRDRNSSYPFVQQFEDAESPFTDEYEIGEYWLVEGKPWFLVPVNKAEQISNINEIEIHNLADPASVFEVLQDAFVPLRNNVYGVIFTTENGRRTRIRVNDFDWQEYDTRRDRDREPKPVTD